MLEGKWTQEYNSAFIGKHTVIKLLKMILHPGVNILYWQDYNQQESFIISFYKYRLMSLPDK